MQGNIAQSLKWEPGSREATLRTYGELTRQAAAGRRLVVWPEAAMPAYVRLDPPALAWLTDLAAEVKTPLLIGAPDAFQERSVTRYLNSAFLVGSPGLLLRYDKIHLVPFGEYVPLKRLLFFVEAIAAEIGDFSPGQRRVVFPLAGAPFGVVICYEVIFPDLFRRSSSRRGPMAPVGATRAETPVLAARATVTPFSTARRGTMARCWSGPPESPNQASLVMLTMKLAPSWTNRRNRSGKITS